MATRTPVITARRSTGRVSTIRVQWTGLLNGDTGAAIDLGEFADRSIEIAGTPGAGLLVVVEGTNDGNNWVTLNDPLGNPLSFTGVGLKQIAELSDQLRLRVTGGDGTTSLTVTMIARAYA